MIDYNVDGDGIATITWDMPDRSMNVLNDTSMTAYAEAVDKAIEDDKVKGVIVTSGKPAFIAGADLEMILGLDTGNPAAMMAQFGELQGLLRKVETSGKPFVAAINGTALGGGLELCLACHYRIAADDPKLKLGQPEVKIGLLPGGGGTQRLPRLMGIQAAAPYLLEGKEMDPKTAKSLNVIDEVVPAGELLARAKAYLLDKPRNVAPWDEKGFKVPGGGPNTPAGAQIFMAGTAMLRDKTYGVYPAPKAILSCVYEGLMVPFDTGLRIETRYFVSLLRDPVSRNMIRSLFFGIQNANKLVKRPEGVDKQKYKKIGVLGAGLMGAGIAYVSARAGIEVVLLDTEQANAEKGKAYSEGLLQKALSRKKTTEEKMRATLDLITPTANYDDLKGCDLVIEAVFENREVKAGVTKQAEAVLGDNDIFASNTSTLPISGLAEASVRPANFIGLHFFSPVDKMPLVEIIVGEKTSQETLARAMDYVQAIRKTPIVVNDARGFFTSRVCGQYIGEGIRMLKEGVPAAMIENGGKMAGMPVGPLTLGDEVAIDLSYKVMKQTQEDLGADYVENGTEDVVDKMVNELGRFGRKNGKGYYEYPEEGPKRLWPELATMFPQLSDDELPDIEEVKKRLLYVQALDTARCLEADVLTAPEDGDVGGILGLGFAPWTGGPISLIDMVGVAEFVKECDILKQKYGAQFDVPKLLRDMADKGESFYGKTPAAQAA